MIKNFLLSIVALLFVTALVGQDNDPVLFTVDYTPVRVSEFEYIYSKTNGDKADFSRASLQEYLDLYTKFKLKVQRAKDMQLDTIPSLQKELEGYRRQLANSYLIDREVTDKLVKEAYDRMQKDVKVSHILVNLPPNASGEDTVKSYTIAKDLMKQLKKGEDFEKLAMKVSDDKSAKDNKGTIGYLTAMLPNGFYEFENAIYNTPVGEMTGPVRSKMGYHIIRVDDVRPARGEVEIAHILIRKPKEGEEVDPAGAKNKIDSIYQSLEGGADFGALAEKFSEDKRSAGKGGYIGFFGINRYEGAFEDAAFGIQEDSTYTKPVETSIGWHILKRLSKKEAEPYDLAKRRLQAQIQRNDRHKKAKESMVARIKKEANYKVYDSNLEDFMSTIDESFLTHKWQVPELDKDQPLFSLGKEKFMISEFAQYCKNATRDRLRGGRRKPQEVADLLFDKFVTDNCLEYEERQLEKKYPEFKALMREYEEGILLFEVTKKLVWDKASQDTTGLKNFFKKVDGRYKWRERAQVSVYRISPKVEDELDKIRKFAKKNPPEAVLEKFNTEENTFITFKEEKIEKGRNPVLDNMTWGAGNVSEIKKDKRTKGISFMKIEKILPPSNKTLEEAKGYVIADYQDQLEKEWVKELKAAYKVTIDDDVFESLVK